MIQRNLVFGIAAQLCLAGWFTNDARAAEDARLVAATWEPLSSGSEDSDRGRSERVGLFRGELSAADGRRLEGTVVSLSGDAPLWLKCSSQGADQRAEQSAPRRWLIADGALIGGEFSRPLRNGDSWFFAATDVARGPWFITGDGCEFAYLRSSLSSRGFDHLEMGLGDLDLLAEAIHQAAPFSAQEHEWLDGAAGASSWFDRYRVLRPGARSARDRKKIRPLGAEDKDRSSLIRAHDGKAVRESLWFSETPEFGSVKPYLDVPARIVVRARRVGEAQTLCLNVDGREHCQDAPDESIATLEDGRVKRSPREHGGKPVSHRLSWKLALSPGGHSLSLSGPALAAVDVMELTGVGRSLGPAPQDPIVYPSTHSGDSSGICRPRVVGSDDVDVAARCEGADRASVSAVAPAEGTEVVSLMLERAAKAERLSSAGTQRAPLPAAPLWVPVPRVASSETAAGAAPTTQNGIASFWFAERDRDCRVEFPDGVRFVGSPAKAKNRFLWMGAGEAASGWPRVSDCRAWMRVGEPPLASEGAASRPGYVLSRYARTAPGLPASYAAAGAKSRDGAEIAAADALWLSWPSKLREAFSIEAHDDAGAQVIDIIPLEDAPVVPSSFGEPYTRPARIKLRLAGSLRVASSEAMAVRLTRRAALSANSTAAAAAVAAGALPLPGSSELLNELRELSSRLVSEFRRQAGGARPTSRDAERAAAESLVAVAAVAERDGARANLLFERAQLLEALGAENSALSDYRWARSLAAQTTGLATGPAAARARSRSDLTTARVLARLLKDQERWMPLQSGWVNETLADDRALVGSFRNGDYLAIAESELPRERRVLAWREAILKGQVLTAEQRISAFVALLSALGVQDSKHPSMWPIRTLSRWQTLHHISGSARPRQEVFRVSTPPTFTERTTDALFPKSWPLQRVVKLRENRELVFPPAEATEISLRCRAHNEAVLESGCVARLVDTQGETVREVTLDGLGLATSLEVPSAKVPLYLQMEPQRLTTRQVLLPAHLAAAQKERKRRQVWHLRKNARADIDVLAPTALRLRTRAQEPVAFAIRVERKTGPKEGRVVVLELETKDGELVIPISERGPHTLTLTPASNVALLASMRVPRNRFIEPAADRQLLASSAQFSPEVGAGRGEEATVPQPPPEADLAIDGFPMPTEPFGSQPGNTPPVTAVIGAFVGSETVADEPERVTRQMTGIALAGVTAKVGETPAWLDAAVQAQGPRDGAVFQGRVGGEWWPLRRRTRFDLMGDVRVGHGTPEATVDTSSESTTTTYPGLTTLKATFRARGGYWLADRWLAQLSLRYDARAILDGEFPDIPAKSQNPVLWSSYQDAHRQALQPAISLRWAVDRWVWLSAIGLVNSNADIVGTPDFVRAEARIDWGAPRWWVRVAGRFERRLDDDDRDGAYNNPALLAKGWLTLWPHGDWALQPSAEVNYHPEFGSVTALAGLRLFWSDDRALGDVRPSRMIFRDAAAWEQDDAARNAQDAEAVPPSEQASVVAEGRARGNEGIQ